MRPIRVERILTGTLIREGAGVKLQRYIGTDKSNDFEPILLFDYFNSAEPLDFMAGFPPHPHRGFETVTYVLEGGIRHQDNQGHQGLVGPGDVQWMTAGKGIIHSEMPLTEGPLRGLQLWLNLPAHDKMMPPRYQEVANAEFPLEHQPSGTIVKVIAGTTDAGLSSPITALATKPLFLDLHLPRGAVFKQSIPATYQALLFVITGEVTVNKQSVKADELAVLSFGPISLHAAVESQKGPHDDLFTAEALATSHCLLIAARQLQEPIVRHGPFVMNSEQEIQQAIADFRSGHFGDY